MNENQQSIPWKTVQVLLVSSLLFFINFGSNAYIKTLAASVCCLFE